MIIDSGLELADAQAVTVSAATTNVVDFEQASPAPGMDGKLKAVITVDTAATSATSGATVTFAIQSSADGSTYQDEIVSRAYTVTDLTAGTQIILPMPMTCQRYLRGYFTASATLTAGAFSVDIVAGVDDNTPTADGLNE